MWLLKKKKMEKISALTSAPARVKLPQIKKRRKFNLFSLSCLDPVRELFLIKENGEN